MVYAVATLDSVLLYDTQQTTPFGYIGNIHYAALTDITWYVLNDVQMIIFVCVISLNIFNVRLGDPGERMDLVK